MYAPCCIRSGVFGVRRINTRNFVVIGDFMKEKETQTPALKKTLPK